MVEYLSWFYEEVLSSIPSTKHTIIIKAPITIKEKLFRKHYGIEGRGKEKRKHYGI